MTGAGDMNLGLESLKGFSGKVLQAVLGFVGTIIFARVLGPTDFGGYYFLLSMIFIADRPLRGFGKAVEKRYSEAGASKSEIFGATLLTSALIFVIAGFIVFGLHDILVQETNLEQAPVVFMAIFVALGIFFPVQKMLGAEGWVSKQTWNDTLRSVFTLPLQLWLVLAGFGAAGMGYGLAAATLLVIPVALHFLRVRPTIPSKATAVSLWTYARYSTVSALVGKAYDRFDVLLLGTLLTTGIVGNYEVAYKLTVPATFLTSVIGSGLTPKVSNRRSQGQKVSADVSNAISYSSLFSIPVLFGTLAIPEVLIRTTYGSEYSGAGVFLIGLALYQVIYSQTLMYQHTLSGLNLPEVRLRINAVTLGINLILGILLLLYIGAVGVVIATIIAEFFRYVMSMLSVNHRLESINILPQTLFEQTFAGILMFAIVEIGQWRVTVQSWIHLGFLVVLGGVAYIVALVMISPSFRFTVLSLYQDMIR